MGMSRQQADDEGTREATANAARWRCHHNRTCRAVVQAGRVLVVHARACPRFRPVILPPVTLPPLVPDQAPAATFTPP